MNEAATDKDVQTEAISDLKYWCKGEPSELGKRVARLLSDWVGGSHHLEQSQMQKVNWSNPNYIKVKADIAYYGGSLATFDFCNLTSLVFLAHDYCIRVDVGPLAPRMLKLMFHGHVRDGGMSQRHPTIEQAVESWRKHNPAT